MLTRLLPEQISTFWDVIKFAVEQSLPPTVGEHPDKMNRILSALLSGRAQCWASYVKGEEGNKFEGVAITQMLYEDLSGTKNMLIYCLYGYEAVDDNSWALGLLKLVKYAKAKECNAIIGFTNVQHLIDIASQLGADASYHYISLNVNKSVQKLNELGLLEE